MLALAWLAAVRAGEQQKGNHTRQRGSGVLRLRDLLAELSSMIAANLTDWG
jgi:hypothetical protein